MNDMDLISVGTASNCYEKDRVFFHCEDGHVVYVGIEDEDNDLKGGN
ncbi:hypothetical protein [Caloranaerobacter sp. DY30410]